MKLLDSKKISSHFFSKKFKKQIFVQNMQCQIQTLKYFKSILVLDSFILQEICCF